MQQEPQRVKTMVLLVNFGGPRTVDEVPAFLRNMLGREAPQPAVRALVSRYQAIGGGSPLAAITEEQAALLSEQTGGRFVIKGAFRYSSPTLEEMINECYCSGMERIVFFVMSPFYTSKTAGSSIEAAKNYLAHLPYRPKTDFIHSWYREPLFVEAWKRKIEEEAAGGGKYYLFAAHSLPQSLAGEPYKSQIEETVQTLARSLGLADNYSLAWQSVPQSVDEPWIGPSVESVIDSISGRIRHLVEVPVGFVSDHLETLYDMDIVHRQYAQSKGLTFSRISSLNTYPAYISALKAILQTNVQEM
jgi:protoporphyrin/coproporphyrin ferrochelatase